MKTNKIDMDFDFIGGQGSLTKIEEKELSHFFKSRKLSAKITIRQQVETTIRPNPIT
jgi:hypothetical protein